MSQGAADLAGTDQGNTIARHEHPLLLSRPGSRAGRLRYARLVKGYRAFAQGASRGKGRRRTALCGPSRPGGANRRGRATIAAAKDPVEIGEIAKARREGDGAHGLPRTARIREQAVRPAQALLQQKGGEARSLSLEQHADIARGDALALRDRTFGKGLVAEMLQDIPLDGVQPRGAQAPGAGDRR